MQIFIPCIPAIGSQEMLLSTVMPVMSIYRLPLGSYGYTGHVIYLPQDVVSFAYSLPRLPSELDVLVTMNSLTVTSVYVELLYMEALTWLLEKQQEPMQYVSMRRLFNSYPKMVI